MKISSKSLPLLGIVLCALHVAVLGNEEQPKQSNDQQEGSKKPDLLELSIAIKDWVAGLEGGFFHKNLEIGYLDGSDSRIGMFTTAPIAKDETLFSVPRNLLVTAGDDKKSYGGLWCPTARNLAKEMRLGDESRLAPYARYMLAQPYGQLPSHWSEPGKAMLNQLLSQDDDNDGNDLPPLAATEWIEQEWKEDCDGSDDVFEQHAALLLIQRGWDDIMIPLFDMLSHRNGKWLNTKTDTVHGTGTKPISVRALRDIVAGEEIYTSYNLCEDCGQRHKGYGTPEILRDYGFVEQYPTRWALKGRFRFTVDQTGPNGEPEIKWLVKKKPTKTEHIRDALKRLEEFDVNWSSLSSPVPSHERNTIELYRAALVEALSLALKDLGDLGKEDEKEDCGDSQQCAITTRYDDLGPAEDPIGYGVYICDTKKSMSFKGFKKIDKRKSHYQKLYFLKDPKNENVCFDIGDIIQICGSYRPHYHEMVVHYAARFVENVKRVVFVGGGDSMLLHDVLKYPNLDLVVGLELDQFVTRLSFKHFGTQPHFDDPRVQWWYGDAAKSLLMLPEEYFGTFDLVLVDLSETVMSFRVTDGLDIFQALQLLLNPGGVLVKNELYFEKMATIFKYRYVEIQLRQCLLCSAC